MARPCANRFCDNLLPEDARPDRKWCDDRCGRTARRIRRNKAGARSLARAARFWSGLRDVRRPDGGWSARGVAA